VERRQEMGCFVYIVPSIVGGPPRPYPTELRIRTLEASSHVSAFWSLLTGCVAFRLAMHTTILLCTVQLTGPCTSPACCLSRRCLALARRLARNRALGRQSAWAISECREVGGFRTSNFECQSPSSSIVYSVQMPLQSRRSLSRTDLRLTWPA